jgi:hypothetical protein
MHVFVMLRHITLKNKPFFTHNTAIWTHITVQENVFTQTTLNTVGLITHTARERTLSSM